MYLKKVVLLLLVDCVSMKSRWQIEMSYKDKACSGELNSEISSQNREWILNYINQRRSSLKASDMWQVEWDDELASLSQAYAETCIMGHGILTGCDGARIGQNVFSQLFADIKAANEGWFDREQPRYDNETYQCSGTCGHFRQMAYGPVRKIGCTMHFCDELIYGNTKYPREYLIVCDYDRSMPGEGSALYHPGPPCSGCSDKTLLKKFIICGKTGLCEGSTDECPDNNCQCNRNIMRCNGHGVLSGAGCETCQCDEGYKGDKCEHNCKDHSQAYCEPLSFLCSFDDDFQKDCPITCKHTVTNSPC